MYLKERSLQKTAAPVGSEIKGSQKKRPAAGGRAEVWVGSSESSLHAIIRGIHPAPGQIECSTA